MCQFFTVMECPGWHYFKCKNDRCIHEDLTCDGADHCGDNSDETFFRCGKDLKDLMRTKFFLKVGSRY